LHDYDFEAEGFRWIDCNDAAHSLLSYYRQGKGPVVVVALNFTPVPRKGYRLGVPEHGNYRLLINSDAGFYAGSEAPIQGYHHSEPTPWMHQPHSIVVDVPPLAGLILVKD